VHIEALLEGKGIFYQIIILVRIRFSIIEQTYKKRTEISFQS